jgi:hypothetical protein
MPFMDRDNFIALLDKLGDADDASCLAAAREIHQRMQAANLKWSDLLAPVGDSDDGDRDESADAGSEPLDNSAEPITEDFALIERLLARSGISDDMRDELTGMREDIGSGDFTARDRKYLQSLEARLSRQG